VGAVVIGVLATQMTDGLRLVLKRAHLRVLLSASPKTSS